MNEQVEFLCHRCECIFYRFDGYVIIPTDGLILGELEYWCRKCIENLDEHEKKSYLILWDMREENIRIRHLHE